MPLWPANPPCTLFFFNNHASAVWVITSEYYPLPDIWYFFLLTYSHDWGSPLNFLQLEEAHGHTAGRLLGRLSICTSYSNGVAMGLFYFSIHLSLLYSLYDIFYIWLFSITTKNDGSMSVPEWIVCYMILTIRWPPAKASGTFWSPIHWHPIHPLWKIKRPISIYICMGLPEPLLPWTGTNFTVLPIFQIQVTYSGSPSCLLFMNQASPKKKAHNSPHRRDARIKRICVKDLKTRSLKTRYLKKRSLLVPGLH